MIRGDGYIVLPDQGCPTRCPGWAALARPIQYCARRSQSCLSSMVEFTVFASAAWFPGSRSAPAPARDRKA